MDQELEARGLFGVGAAASTSMTNSFDLVRRLTEAVFPLTTIMVKSLKTRVRDVQDAKVIVYDVMVSLSNLAVKKCIS